MRRTLVVLLGFLPLLAACGDGEAQCRAYCASLVRVNLVPPLSAPGTYEFELQADAWSTRCEVTHGEEIPLYPLYYPDNTQCESMDGRLSAEGDSFWAVSSVIIHQYAPKKVTVRISHDGKVIREQTFMPTYEFHEVCGKRCASAELEL